MAPKKTKNDDILNAATKVFSNKGYHNATMVDIANEAGVGKGTIYEYFKGKDDLFLKMIDFNVEKYIKLLHVYIDKGQGIETTIENIVDFHSKIIIEGELLLSSYKPVAMLSTNPNDRIKVQKKFQSARQSIINVIISVFEEYKDKGVVFCDDVEFISDMIYAMVVRFCIRYTFSYDKADTERFQKDKKSLVDVILRVLKYKKNNIVPI